jgi:hypothetical protein
MILDAYEIVLLWAFIVLYSITVLLAANHAAKQKTTREKPLSFLLLLHLIAFYFALFTTHLLLDSWKPDLRDLATINVFLIVGSFVTIIEVPGFILISNYDDKSVEVLSEVRKNLVSVAFNFNHSLENLQSLQKANEVRLSEQNVSGILDYFVKSCARVKNVDASLLNLTLSEINLSIREVSQQSKHPFPRLLDILSLTGLSFLIAQLLR